MICYHKQLYPCDYNLKDQQENVVIVRCITCDQIIDQSQLVARIWNFLHDHENRLYEELTKDPASLIKGNP